MGFIDKKIFSYVPFATVRVVPSKSKIVAAMTAAATALCLPHAAEAQGVSSVVDISNVLQATAGADPSSLHVVAINNKGRIAGDYWRAGTYRAFTANANGTGSKEVSPGGWDVYARALNDYEQVVGVAYSSSIQYPFMTDANGLNFRTLPISSTYVPATGVEVMGINSSGQILGETGFEYQGWVPFISSANGGGISYLPRTPASNPRAWEYSDTSGLNNKGIFAGTKVYINSIGAIGSVQTYVWDGEKLVYPAWPSNSAVHGVGLLVDNNGNYIVHYGASANWAPTVFSSTSDAVGKPVANPWGCARLTVFAVNDADQIVGSCAGGNSANSLTRYFVSGANFSGMYEITSALGAVSINKILGINNNGQVLVVGTDQHYYTFSVTFSAPDPTPTPNPTPAPTPTPNPPAPAPVPPTMVPEADATQPVLGCNQNKSGEGCTTWDVQKASLSLQLHDRPVGYTAPVGPAVYFDVYYSQRDGQQAAAPTYSNLGPKWTNTWTSFVTYTAGDKTAKLFGRGGGGEVYIFGSGTTSSISPYTQAQLREILDGSGRVIGFTRILRDGTIEKFLHINGSQFMMTSLIDPQGNCVNINYDSVHRISTIVDALGQATTFSYGLSSDPLKITKVTDPFGRFASFGYAGGQLSSITDTIGITSSFNYTGTFVDTLKTPYGVTRFSFSDSTTNAALGTTRILTVTDPMNRTSRYEYNDNAPGVAASDKILPSGLLVANSGLNTRNTYVWDAQQYAIATAGGGLDYTKATITHWALSSDGLSVSRVPESVKRPLESRIWYNYLGQTDSTRVGSTSLPVAIGRVLDNGSTQLQTFAYNSVGNVIKQTDPSGRTTVNTYNANGIDLETVTNVSGGVNRVLFSATYNDQHEALTVVGADGQAVKYSYNAAGQRTKYTDPKGNSTIWGYSGAYLTSITRPNGARVTIVPDAVGRIGSLTDEAGISVGYQYDNADRVQVKSFMDGTTVKYSYNLLDLYSVTNRMGKTSLFGYNSDRELISEADPLGNMTKYGRAPSGALNSITDSKGKVTNYGLDAESRVISKKYPDGMIWSYTYEENTSRLHSRTDALGQVKVWSYNRDNTTATITYGNTINPTANVSLSYDTAFVRPTSISDGAGVTTVDYYAVGALGAGEPKTVSLPVGGVSSGDTLSFGYDELNRLTNQSINGSAQTYSFDEAGRLVAANNKLDSFTYGYADATGRVTEIAASSGFKLNITYLSAAEGGLMKEMVYTGKAGTPVAQFTYDYDANDNVTTFGKAYNGQSLPVVLGIGIGGSVLMFGIAAAANCSKRRRWMASALPISAAVVVASCGGGGDTNSAAAGSPGTNSGTPPSITKYLYDDAQRLTGAVETTKGAWVLTPQNGYGYDAASNVISLTRDGVTTIQEVNDVNQLTSAQYDANGNTKVLGSATYDWDGENRLYRYVDGDKESDFAYNGANQVVRIVDKVSGSVVSDKGYVWLGDRVVQERNNLAGGAISKQYFDQGVAIQGEVFYYVKDHLGSVRQLVDAAGKVRAQYEYDPYGNRTMSVGDVKSDIGYAGYFHHEASGLDLTANRAYDAQHARWLNRDPIGEAGGVNLYGYVGGNPMLYVDASGLYSLPVLTYEATRAIARLPRQIAEYTIDKLKETAAGKALGFYINANSGFLLGEEDSDFAAENILSVAMGVSSSTIYAQTFLYVFSPSTLNKGEDAELSAYLQSQRYNGSERNANSLMQSGCVPR